MDYMQFEKVFWGGYSEKHGLFPNDNRQQYEHEHTHTHTTIKLVLKTRNFKRLRGQLNGPRLNPHTCIKHNQTTKRYQANPKSPITTGHVESQAIFTSSHEHRVREAPCSHSSQHRFDGTFHGGRRGFNQLLSMSSFFSPWYNCTGTDGRLHTANLFHGYFPVNTYSSVPQRTGHEEVMPTVRAEEKVVRAREYA